MTLLTKSSEEFGANGGILQIFSRMHGCFPRWHPKTTSWRLPDLLIGGLQKDSGGSSTLMEVEQYLLGSGIIQEGGRVCKLKQACSTTAIIIKSHQFGFSIYMIL